LNNYVRKELNFLGLELRTESLLGSDLVVEEF